MPSHGIILDIYLTDNYTLTMRIEPYNKGKHREALLIALRETWHFHEYFPQAKNPQIVYELFLDLALLSSCHINVVLLHDEPVGLLAGRVIDHYPLSCRLSHFIKSISFYSKLSYILFTQQLGKLHQVIQRLKEINTLETQTNPHKKGHDAVIELFYLHPKARGHGAGKALMDHFVAYARIHQASSIVLWTDISCNYPFYDRYGFYRKATFSHPLLAISQENEENGFIYVYLLNNEIK